MARRTTEQIYEEWLVIRCQGGDTEALPELIGRWKSRLGVFVWRLTDGHDDTLDIVQDTWIVVFKKLNRLNDPACFPQWVYRIATAKYADWVRKKKRDRGLHKTVAEESVNLDKLQEVGNANNKLDTLREAIKKLPPDRRTIISLFYIDELSTDAIAESLGIPIGAVKSRLFSAREILKKTIERSDQ